MNTEDLNTSPSVAPPPNDEMETETKSNTNGKMSGFTNILRKIGFGFLFLVLGMLIIGIAFYLPAKSNLKTSEVELERLRPIETAYEDMLVEHERVNIQRVVYKILANASQMHIALINEDNSRIAQYLQYIEDDLSSLTIPDFPDLPASLQEQISKVSDMRVTDKPGALNALQLFQNDLLLLIDNLE